MVYYFFYEKKQFNKKRHFSMRDGPSISQMSEFEKMRGTKIKGEKRRTRS
jgi:hypothetical protein